MRSRVPHDLERGRFGLFEQLERDVFGERRGEVDDARRVRGAGRVHCFFRGFECGFAFAGGCRVHRRDTSDDDSRSEARRDAGGDVEGRGVARDFADGAVRKLDFLWSHSQVSRINGLLLWSGFQLNSSVGESGERQYESGMSNGEYKSRSSAARRMTNKKTGVPVPGMAEALGSAIPRFKSRALVRWAFCVGRAACGGAAATACGR